MGRIDNAAHPTTDRCDPDLPGRLSVHPPQHDTRKALTPEPTKPHPLLAAVTGVSAGFTTMVANAAGPIMIMYLLAMRLPKLVFMGTSAWYFFVLNLFKVPFSYSRA